MSLSMKSALAALDQGASVHEAAGPARERLGSVQALLERDLAAVETALEQAVADGPSPGRDAARHLVTRAGKRVRPLALMLSARCFGTVTPAMREAACVAELVHSATLLHDDVIDDGEERRGTQAARRIWGNAVSVLGGDLLLVAALERTERHAPVALGSLITTLRRLVEGEIVQLRGRTELDVSEATYLEILLNKTASLFAWSTATGAKLAGASDVDQERMRKFGELMGIAFQLVDDVLDYSGENTGKTLHADLLQGKLTLPLVLAAGRKPELLERLRSIHAGDLEHVPAVSRAVVDSGACEEVRVRALEHTTRAVATLDGIPAGGARTLLEQVANDLARRLG
jgi:octaprenyl-diphosphate synthase